MMDPAAQDENTSLAGTNIQLPDNIKYQIVRKKLDNEMLDGMKDGANTNKHYRGSIRSLDEKLAGTQYVKLSAAVVLLVLRYAPNELNVYMISWTFFEAVNKTDVSYVKLKKPTTSSQAFTILFVVNHACTVYLPNIFVAISLYT